MNLNKLLNKHPICRIWREGLMWRHCNVGGVSVPPPPVKHFIANEQYLRKKPFRDHYDDVRMGAITSRITSLTIVYSIVYSDADKKKSKLRVTGIWAVPRTNGQLRGKCFHLMTSSWWKHHIYKYKDSHFPSAPSSSYAQTESICFYGTGVGFTNASFVNFFVREIFVPAKEPARLFESYSYLIGATAAQLRCHLSNMNLIFSRKQVFWWL